MRNSNDYKKIEDWLNDARENGFNTVEEYTENLYKMKNPAKLECVDGTLLDVEM